MLLASVAGALSSVEFLAIHREFRSDGIFAWRVMSSRPDVLRLRAVRLATDRLYSYVGSLLVCSLRGAAFLALPFIWHNAQLRGVALGLALVTTVLLAFRNPFGGDGSDQMTCVAVVGLSVYAAADSQALADIGLGFVAAQSILSYVVSGVAKAVSPSWRGGHALRAIMNTRTYGHSRAATVLARAPGWANVALCWLVIGFECAFVLAPVLPPYPLLVLLGTGALFHLANVYVMGLNTFFWAFVASYPCVLYLNHLSR